MGGSFTRMAKPSDVLRRRHSKVCEVLDVSETTFRSLVGKLFSAGTIDMTTKATVLRKLGHEGADKLMDILEMKVEARPDRLQSILEIMVQEESLRDIFVDVVKETEDVTSGGSNHAHTPMIPNLVTNNPSVTIGVPGLNPTHPVNLSHVNSPRTLDKDDIEKLKSLINRTIENIYSKLHSATSGALPELVKLLFEAGLVGKELLSSSPDYDGMMKSFFATLEWDESVKDLEKDCTKFIRALDKIGGPARKAGERISSDLKRSVKETFGFDFKTP